MKSTELRGYSVVADGKHLGDIERAYFDPKQRTVVGFAISTGGGFLMPEAGLIADSDEIHSIGRDAIMLTSPAPAGTKTNERYGELIDLETLHGRELYSDQGQRLGRVEWSEFDEQNFALTGLVTYSGVGHHQEIAANRIIAIGPDVVTVKAGEPGSPPS
jgi:uncharacterized protein YrrD